MAINPYDKYKAGNTATVDTNNPYLRYQSASSAAYPKPTTFQQKPYVDYTNREAPMDKVFGALGDTAQKIGVPENIAWGIRDLPKNLSFLDDVMRSVGAIPGHEMAKQHKAYAQQWSGAVRPYSPAIAAAIENVVEAPGQVVQGMWSGATHGLYKPDILTQPETPLGKATYALSSLYGFSELPGKLFYSPVEAPVEKLVGGLAKGAFGRVATTPIMRALTSGAGKVAAATAAEATSSLPVAALESAVTGKPFITQTPTTYGVPYTNIPLGTLPIGGTYPENVYAGLSSRVMFGAARKGLGAVQEGIRQYKTMPPEQRQAGFISLAPDDWTRVDAEKYSPFFILGEDKKLAKRGMVRISDVDAKVSTRAFNQLLKAPDGTVKTLPDVFKHDLMYKTVPELKNVKVTTVNYPGEEAVGWVGDDGRTIVLNKSADWTGKQKPWMLHEIQHIISDMQGFSPGGNMKIAQVLKPQLEAQAAKRISELSPKIKAEQTKYDSVVNNINTKYFSGQITEAQKNKMMADVNATRANNPAIQEFRSLMRRQSLKIPGIYSNLAGEALARGVEAQSEMTQKQLRNVNPYYGSGVTSLDQLIYRNPDIQTASDARLLRDMSQARVEAGTPLTQIPELAGIKEMGGTKAPVGMEFYSYQKPQGYGIEQAMKDITSPTRARAVAMNDEIDAAMGLKSVTQDVVGDWRDAQGKVWTESSFVNVLDGVRDFDELRYNTAVKARINDELGALAFMPDPAGTDKVHIIDTDISSVIQLRSLLDAAGIPDRSIAPLKEGGSVVIFDQGGRLGEVLNTFANNYGTRYRTITGRGESIGGTSRVEARRNYTAIEDQYKTAYPGRRYYTEPVRTGIADFWDTITGRTTGTEVSAREQLQKMAGLPETAEAKYVSAGEETPSLRKVRAELATFAYANAIENGGVTVSLVGKVPTQGYVYSPYKQYEKVILPTEKFDEVVVQKYLDTHAGTLKHKNHFLGIWIDEDGKIFLDVSVVLGNKNEALYKANIAKQEGVFDLKKFETVYTPYYYKVHPKGGEVNEKNIPGYQQDVSERNIPGYRQVTEGSLITEEVPEGTRVGFGQAETPGQEKSVKDIFVNAINSTKGKGVMVKSTYAPPRYDPRYETYILSFNEYKIPDKKAFDQAAKAAGLTVGGYGAQVSSHPLADSRVDLEIKTTDPIKAKAAFDKFASLYSGKAPETSEANITAKTPAISDASIVKKITGGEQTLKDVMDEVGGDPKEFIADAKKYVAMSAMPDNELNSYYKEMTNKYENAVTSYRSMIKGDEAVGNFIGSPEDKYLTTVLKDLKKASTRTEKILAMDKMWNAVHSGNNPIMSYAYNMSNESGFFINKTLDWLAEQKEYSPEDFYNQTKAQPPTIIPLPTPLTPEEIAFKKYPKVAHPAKSMVSGFLTTDGKWIETYTDHPGLLRDVGFGYGVDSVNAYLEQGGIRTFIDPRRNVFYIEMHTAPTPQQLKQLEKLPGNKGYAYDFYTNEMENRESNFGGIEARDNMIATMKKTYGLSDYKIPETAEALYAGKKAATYPQTGEGTFSMRTDRLPRFELDDSKAKFHTEEIMKWMDERKDTRDKDGTIGFATLENILDYPELYKAYPGIEKTPIQVTYKPERNDTAWNYKSKTGERGIGLNMNIAWHSLPNTILHELQHVIQEKENFAMGGSPGTARNIGVGQTMKMPVKKQDFINLYQDYRSLAGEVEARDAASRLNLTAEERAQKPPLKAQRTKLQNMIVKRKMETIPETSEALYAGEKAKTYPPTREGVFTYTKESLMDTKPRFEIDDSKAKMLIPNKRGVYHNRLGKIINHPDLEAAYPELMDTITDVHIIPTTVNEHGAFTTRKVQPYNNGFYGEPIDKSTITIFAKNPQRAKELLLHEIQHSIQTKEGFLSGTSAGKFGTINRELVRPIKERIGLKLIPFSQSPDYEEYMFLTQRIKGQPSVEQWKRILELEDKFGIRDDVQLAEKTIKTPFKQYRQNPGEREARDVALRAALTAPERATTQPGSMQKAEKLPREIAEEQYAKERKAPETASARSTWSEDIEPIRIVPPVAPGGNINLRPGREGIGKLPNSEEFVARRRFVIPNLEKIGAGSDRIVFDLGDKMVVKIAKTARGIDQNYSENDYLAQEQGLIPEVKEIGKNYIVQEKVDPPNEKTKRFVKELNTFGFEDYSNMTARFQDFLREYGMEDFMNWDVAWGDMKRIKNWGSKNGEPILLDGGTLNAQSIKNEVKYTNAAGLVASRPRKNMEDPEFRESVRLSREAKKDYGETDKYKMFAAIPFLIPLLKKEEKREGELPKPLKDLLGAAL